MPEPENMIIHLLKELREEIHDIRSDLKSDMAELRSEVKSLRADVASDFISLEKRMNDQFVTLRRSVMEYHSTAVGHGILYSELDERVRRIEQRLDMEPSGAR
jgi:uncharacterized coiled-coil DUF342 family protein